MEVSIAGGQSTVTADGGYYRISGVQAGTITLEVSFTGYQGISTTVTVPPGQTVTRDFELSSSLVPAGAGDPITLESFIVSSEREGNAKAIMDQRQSMNITNTVASDVFGDVAEGNIGEFLKHLPGVDGDMEDGTMRYIRLRGNCPRNTRPSRSTERLWPAQTRTWAAPRTRGPSASSRHRSAAWNRLRCRRL